MICAVRKIKENSNNDLQINTDRELYDLVSNYKTHPVEKVIKSIDYHLEHKTQGYIDSIRFILNKSPMEVHLSYELRVLKKIFFSPLYPTTSLGELNSSMDIFKLYQRIFLLLKRIEFGFIQDKNTFLNIACEEYKIRPADFSFVLALERV